MTLTMQKTTVQKTTVLRSDIKIWAALGLLVVAGLLLFGSGWTGGLATAGRNKALAEVSGRLGLMEGTGAVYVDRQTQAATVPSRARDYAEGLKRAFFHAPAAFVTDASLFNETIERDGEAWLKEQKQGQTWKDILSAEMQKNVLRALVVSARGKDAAYYLMPTSAFDPVLVSIFDGRGVRRRLRGSYGDVVPFRRTLRQGWYLLFVPPGQAGDFSALRGEKSIRLLYAGTSDWAVSVALIDVPKNAALNSASTSIFMMPLLEG